MGGCRCCFRRCPVSTDRNKGMHFFKFPIKDIKRLEVWCKYAGRWPHFLKLSKSQLCNKVVCSRHFPDNHFMNYKCNRLTGTATPFLQRLSEEYAWDYSKDVDRPVLIKLPPVTIPHLIPPNGFPNTMKFTADDRKLADEALQFIKDNKLTELSKTQSKYQQNVQSAAMDKEGSSVDSISSDGCEEFLLNDEIIWNGSEAFEIESCSIDDISTEDKNLTQGDSYVQNDFGKEISFTSKHSSTKNLPSIISNPKRNENLIKTPDKFIEHKKLTVFIENDIKSTKAKDGSISKRRYSDATEIQIYKKAKENQKTVTIQESCSVPSDKNENYSTTDKILNEVNNMHSNDIQIQDEIVPNYDNEIQDFKDEIMEQSLPVLSDKINDESITSEDSARLEKVIFELLESEGTVSELKSKVDKLIKINGELSTQLEMSVKKQTELKDALKNMEFKYDQLVLDNNRLQENLTELQNQQAMLKLEPQTQQKLTKTQLFNGIKKYLSQTMVALLRIQLSSGSEEREYRPDERRLAIDLIGLGAHVYRYFTEEWLIRLPPLRQVTLWRNEDKEFSYDDDDL